MSSHGKLPQQFLLVCARVHHRTQNAILHLQQFLRSTEFNLQKATDISALYHDRDFILTIRPASRTIYVMARVSARIDGE